MTKTVLFVSVDARSLCLILVCVLRLRVRVCANSRARVRVCRPSNNGGCRSERFGMRRGRSF